MIKTLIVAISEIICCRLVSLDIPAQLTKPKSNTPLEDLTPPIDSTETDLLM